MTSEYTINKSMSNSLKKSPGRPKQKIYLYDSEGKFIKKYESTTEFLKENFPDDKGKRPIKNTRRWKLYNYDVLPNGNFFASYKIGREKLNQYEAIVNSKYCVNLTRTEKVVEAYNMLDEKIAEFKNAYIANLITGRPSSSIIRDCREKKGNKVLQKEIYFKYKEE